MSILDKSFLTELIVLPPVGNYDELAKFMSDKIKIKTIFPSADLLVNLNMGEGSDTFNAVLFEYESKYIFLEIYEGTCNDCITSRYNTDYNVKNAISLMFENAIQNAYISTNSQDILTYMYKKINAINAITANYSQYE